MSPLQRWERDAKLTGELRGVLDPLGNLQGAEQCPGLA